MSRSKTIIEIVKLVNSLDSDKVVGQPEIDKLTELINDPSTSITTESFHMVARHFIINGLRSNRGCRMILTPDQFKIYGSTLNFILNKPVSFFEDYEPFENILPSMSHFASRKINAAYECLNNSQKVAFTRLHKSITDSLAVNDVGSSASSSASQRVYPIKEPFFGVINSRSGTGKSTIMGVMGCSLLTPMLFVVYSTALKEAAANLHPNINAMTTCSFNMKCLNKSFVQAKNLFDQSQNRSLCNIFTRLFRLVQLFKLPVLEDDNSVPYLIVVDEMTTLSPYMIIYLHLVGRHCKLNFLMVGDANQQKAIRTTVYHRMHNMFLLKSLVNFDMLLSKQMRIDDTEYLKIINEIELYLDENSDNVKMEFNHKFKLYSLLTRHFHMNECPTAMFIASTHATSKARILRCVKRVPRSDVLKSEYCKKVPKGPYISVMLNSNYKFPPILVLIKGYQYIRYGEKSKNEEVVTFVDRVDEDTLLIRNSANELEKITRISCTTQNTIEELLHWLDQAKARYQFPLRFFTSTYYSAQGLTLDKCDLELDFDDTTMNAAYVGLTRIRHGSRLKRLHTRDVLSLALTMAMNDEYYYKLPENIELPVFVGSLDDSIRQLHRYLYENLRSAKFATVECATFKSGRGRYMKVDRAKYEYFVKSNQTEKSQLIESYDCIKNMDTKTLFEMTPQTLHDHINCTCDLDWVKSYKPDDDDDTPASKKRKVIDLDDIV